MKYVAFSAALIAMCSCSHTQVEQTLNKISENEISAVDSVKANSESEVKKLFSGVRKTYYDKEEKKIMSEVTYVDGHRDGKAIDYYKNGQPRLVGGNLMGQIHGDLTYYYEDGSVYRKTSYDYGDMHGWDTLFYKSGRPKHAIPYNDGEVLEGMVEWDARYQKIPLPKIKLREVSRVETEGKFFLFVKFEEQIEDAQFYLAVIGNGSAKTPQYPFDPMAQIKGNDEQMFTIPLNSGYEIAAKILIKGTGKTKRGNPFEVRQAFPVVMR